MLAGEYEYKVPWAVAAGCASGAFVLANTAIGSFSDVWKMYTNVYIRLFYALLSVLLLIGSLFLIRHTIRIVRCRMLPGRRIILEHDSMDVPCSVTSAEGTPVLYSSITRISYTQCFGHKRIRIDHAGGKVMILGSELPRKTDADEILQVLAEKTSLAIRTPVCWPRQFSLLSILLLTTFCAVVLGLMSWISPGHPRLSLIMLAVLLGVLGIQGVVVWLVLSAPRWARIFAFGFAIGALLEWAVLRSSAWDSLLWSIPGPGRFAEWYPLTVPIHRCVTQSLSMGTSAAIVCSLLLGLVGSGTLGGCVLLIIFSIGARSLGRTHR